MSKIITEIKVDGIPIEKIIRELQKKKYSKKIMFRPYSDVVIFDKTEDLIRFVEFIHKYQENNQ